MTKEQSSIVISRKLVPLGLLGLLIIVWSICLSAKSPDMILVAQVWTVIMIVITLVHRVISKRDYERLKENKDG